MPLPPNAISSSYGTGSSRLHLQEKLSSLRSRTGKGLQYQGVPTRQGRGLFAAAGMRELTLVPVEEEGRLKDPALRENFVERVFAYHRWQLLARGRRSISSLVDFHTRHKFLLLAHSERHYRKLGRVVAKVKHSRGTDAYRQYGHRFMEGLAIHATVKKHCNVLCHMMGYFSKELSRAEREELIGHIVRFSAQPCASCRPTDLGSALCQQIRRALPARTGLPAT
jgi:uncharacterized protein YbgA (DUF1722 family)